jgi:glycosyltransferase involved in cell wall biosynthesis
MRVLYLSPSNRLLGARQSLVDLVTHLPRDVEPLVVCPGEGELHCVLREHGIAVEAVPHFAWRKLVGRVRSQFQQVPALRRLVARFQPDIVHANEYHAAPQALAAAQGRVPVIAHVRNTLPPGHGVKYLLGHCARVIIVSEAIRSTLGSAVPQERVQVVYNGVDVSRFTPASSREALQEVEWPATALVAGLFGLVSERKNQLIAAEAVALAASRGVDVRLLLAGDAFKSSLAYGETLRARIGQPDLRDRVLWLPFQSDVAALYRACDVNLLVSGEEGFGRTIIEAGACGLPSIGARTGGIPEIIVEGETGWLVPPGDSAALAEVLVKAVGEGDLLRKMGGAARVRVGEKFALSAMVSGMETTYTEVCEERRDN